MRALALGGTLAAGPAVWANCPAPERRFLGGLLADPTDAAARAAYADWLESCDRHREALAHRVAWGYYWPPYRDVSRHHFTPDDEAAAAGLVAAVRADAERGTVYGLLVRSTADPAAGTFVLLGHVTVVSVEGWGVPVVVGTAELGDTIEWVLPAGAAP